MATMKDVANLAGVSVSAVSHVLNGTKQFTPQTTKRILDAIEQTGYAPHTLARSLRVGKTNTIGILVEDIRGLPVAEVVNGISEYLRAKNYQLLLSDLHLLEDLYNQYEQIIDYRNHINNGLKLLLKNQVDGIIYVGMHDRHLDGIIDPIDTPLVYAYSHGANQDYYVTYDNASAAILATNHLILNGHKDIAVITGHPNSYPTYKRMKGFYASMEKAELPVKDEWIQYGDWEYDSGYLLTKKMLSGLKQPTAIFAMNDLMAVGVINAAKEMAYNLPDDLSVVGFDNREIAGYTLPKLTTVQLPTKEIGFESAKLLIEMIQHKSSGNSFFKNEQHIILPCSLVERESVKPL